MGNSKIEWTERTWNPTTGCGKVSQGCKNCYAEREWVRLVHLPRYKGRNFTDVACHEDRLLLPLSWKKPRRVFVNSMSDLFHPDVPFTFIDKVFAVMALCPQHTFQVLTKRPERMRLYLYSSSRRDVWALAGDSLAERMELQHYVNISHRGPAGNKVSVFSQWPLPNVWLGVSVEDQATADERIPLLLQTPAAVRWISAEPLLGRIDLTTIRHGNDEDLPILGTQWGLDWVVVGGESGPNARHMSPDWARALRDQCAAAGVPFLFKQWGEWLPMLGQAEGVPVRATTTTSDGWVMGLVGKKAAGRLLDGVLHDAYPEVK